MDIIQNNVLEIMEQVADWQIANYVRLKKGHYLSWTNATLYIGVMELAGISENDFE